MAKKQFNASKPSKVKPFKGEKGFKKEFKMPKDLDKVLNKTENFKSCNDIKWYGLNPAMLRDAANVQYSQILGLKYQLVAENATASYTIGQSIPGIMTINYIPGVGVSDDVNSNINVAARLLYTYVRHANSGSRNYEAPDLMTYCLGVANAQAYYAFMVRLYGLINHHSVMNRYITRALVTAAGGDYDDLVRNMAAFRYYINNFANKLNSLAVPKDQYYFDRASFLPLHIFTDGEDDKSQMYVFKPHGYFSWTGTKYETGSALEFKFLNAVNNLDTLITFGNALLNALLENEDIGIMSGDILKAFGASGIRQISMIASEFATPIIKDDGVLAQIHNLTAMYHNHNIKPESYDIKQEGGILKYKLYATQRTIATTVLLDSPYSEPGPDYTMEATRLVSIWKKSDSSDGFNTMLATSGTEVVKSITLYEINPSTGDLQSYTLGTLFTESDLETRSTVSRISKFDWHPILYWVEESGSSSSPIISGLYPVGDLQNYTTIDTTVVDRMHNCAIQSLFNVFGLYIKTQ